MLFHSTKKPTELSVINLNKKQKSIKERLKQAGAGQTDKKGLLCRLKTACCHKVSCNKTKKADEKSEGCLYVIDFNGDIKASGVEKLREEISAIISIADKDDEVMVRLDSSGGQVHSYGLAAAQLERLGKAGLKLTVCVDKVAASGGYMMACVADTLIAAPFAIIGSIGVVSQMPNFYDFLKKHDINVELFTAGEYKRTVTLFGENDDDDRAKYQQELERIHELFKQHVIKHRQSLDIQKVATGEFWFGSDALALDLIDDIGTSDSYLLEKMKTHTVLALHSHQKPTLMEKVGLAETGSAVLQQAAAAAKDGLVFGANKLTRRLPL